MALPLLDASEVPQPLAPMPWEKGPPAARPRSDAGGSGFGSHGSGSQSTGASGQGQDGTGESWEEASSSRGSGSGSGRLSGSRLKGGGGAAAAGKAKQMEDFLSREGGSSRAATGADDALTQGGLPDSSSRDGASRDGSAPADASDDLLAMQGQLPSLQKDGASANMGSAGHPDECKPCAFYCYSLRGCRNGEACMYCHLFHESRLRQRREEWKRTQREKRRRQREKRDHAGAAGFGDAAAAAAPAAAGWVEDPHQAEATAARPSAAGAAAIGALPVPATTPVAMQARKPAQAPAAHMPAAAAAAASSAVAAPANELAWRPAAPPPQQEAKRPAERRPTPALGALAQAAASVDGGAPLAAGLLAAAGGAEFFAYTPNAAVVNVGEALELWPPVPLAMSGPIFAVSPELPSGLRIDERMGVIYGKPLVGMADSTTYFVAACKPGDLTFNVKISMVNLKVVGPPTVELGF